MVNGRYVLVVHGGAGNITNEVIAPGKEKQARQALEEALLAGHAVLAKGGSSLDAVEAAIKVLEDQPIFNAGKGAAFNNAGGIELDAAIMNGKTRAAGAVACVTTVKNPISAARAVMERSPHVMLMGLGADQFAAEIGLETVKPSYFWTPERWEQLWKELSQDKQIRTRTAHSSSRADTRAKHGTVGAVAVDVDGNLAAGTSTGGISSQQYGRVGDAPIIGAGTYAANDSCAVSATGHGEYFMRWVAAHEIASLIRYRGLTVEQAAAHVIQITLLEAGGRGGVIAVGRGGDFAMEFNSEGMYRGYIHPDGKPHTFIFKRD